MIRGLYRERFQVFSLFAIAAGLTISLCTPYLLFGDDIEYISVADGILATGHYQSIIPPNWKPETSIPPGLPLLLIPFRLLAPDDLFPMRLFFALVSGAGLILAVRYHRIDPPADSRFPSPSLLVGLVPLAFFYSSRILTEGPMILFGYGALLLAEKKRPAAAAAVVLAAMYTKQAAWGLVAGLMIDAAVRRNFRQALWIACFIGFGLAPWWTWQNLHGSDYISSHVLQRNIYAPSSGAISLLSLHERMLHNGIRYLGRSVGEAVGFPFVQAPAEPIDPETLGGASRVLFSFTASILIGAGILRRWLRPPRAGRRWRAEDGYLIGMGGLLLVHPVYDHRYLVPLLPALIRNLTDGLTAVAGPHPRVRQGVGALLATGTLFLSTYTPTVAERAFVDLSSRAGSLTPENAVVLARKPAVVWWYGRRHAAGYPASPDSDELRNTLLANDARHLIEDRFPYGPRAWEEYLVPALDPIRGEFQVLARSAIEPGFALLYWRPDSTSDSVAALKR